MMTMMTMMRVLEAWRPASGFASELISARMFPFGWVAESGTGPIPFELSVPAWLLTREWSPARLLPVATPAPSDCAGDCLPRRRRRRHCCCCRHCRRCCRSHCRFGPVGFAVPAGFVLVLFSGRCFRRCSTSRRTSRTSFDGAGGDPRCHRTSVRRRPQPASASGLGFCLAQIRPGRCPSPSGIRIAGCVGTTTGVVVWRVLVEPAAVVVVVVVAVRSRIPRARDRVVRISCPLRSPPSRCPASTAGGASGGDDDADDDGADGGDDGADGGDGDAPILGETPPRVAWPCHSGFRPSCAAFPPAAMACMELPSSAGHRRLDSRCSPEPDRPAHWDSSTTMTTSRRVSA